MKPVAAQLPQRRRREGAARLARGLAAAAPALVVAGVLAGGARPLHAVTDRPLKSTGGDVATVADTADVTFVVGGDNRPPAKGVPQPRVLSAMLDEIGLFKPALVLWTGDSIYGYCDTAAELAAEYDGFLALAGRAGAPLFNVPGNHEIHPGADCPAGAPPICDAACLEAGFKQRFGAVYGSFDYAGVHFIGLDSEMPGQEDAILGDQLAWLERDLEANKTARAIFIFDHTEFYSSPKIAPDEIAGHTALANRAILQDLFRRYPVKAVFSGHQHLYWHEPAANHDGIDYFIAAGSGAPLYTDPERGGFAHYLLVRLTGTKLTYDPIEPGHLYLEPAPARTPGESRLWLINANHLSALTLSGLRVEVPATLGPCADLVAATDLRNRKGDLLPIPLRILACTPGPTTHTLLLEATKVPQGAIPIVIHRR